MRQWVETTEEQPWRNLELGASAPEIQAREDLLVLTGRELQRIEGFGGAFSELSWKALSALPEGAREEVLLALFGDEGCRFNFCRIPIGASDYALDWYSCDECAGDYAMEHFSIARDKRHLLPYIKAAQRLRPDLRFFASPWSPPTWMKTPAVYNSGRLKNDPETLRAYALYFEKFVLAYRGEGIPISRLHIQNEPFADQKFPSCLWDGALFRVFIRDYLGPMFERDRVGTELWFGTLNGPGLDLNAFPFSPPPVLYDSFVEEVLADAQARRYLAGVGYQWAGKASIQRTHESYPELKLMQTESECGDGENTWAYARYTYNLIHHYLSNGADSYICWNLALPEHGTSTWGWNQNALITVNPHTGEVRRNPEYTVVHHLSRFVERGAVLLETRGHFTGASLAFRNPDGGVVLTVSNFLERERPFAFAGAAGAPGFSAVLAPLSLNTFVL